MTVQTADILLVAGGLLGLLLAIAMAWSSRSRRRDATAEPAQAPRQRRHVRLPLPIMTGEQSKLLALGLGALTAPFLAAGYARFGFQGEGVAAALGAWGGTLVVVATVTIGGKPDPKVTAAVDRAARVIEESTSGDRHEVARAVRSTAP